MYMGKYNVVSVAKGRNLGFLVLTPCEWCVRPHQDLQFDTMIAILKRIKNY